MVFSRVNLKKTFSLNIVNTFTPKPQDPCPPPPRHSSSTSYYLNLNNNIKHDSRLMQKVFKSNGILNLNCSCISTPRPLLAHK